VARRTKRVAELIRHELGKVLIEDIADPRIGFLTVTRVEVSSDLRVAKAFVSFLGSEAEQRTCLRGLQSARQRIQSALGERLTLRVRPEVLFRVDEGVKHSLEMSRLLSELAREREERAASTEADADTAEELEDDGG